MYICICNAVTEKAIRDAVHDGARSVMDLSLRTGASTQCGTCRDLIREILDETLDQIGAQRGPVGLKVVARS